MSHLRIAFFSMILTLVPMTGRADQTIVQAEYAFGRAVAANGIRRGFLQFLDRKAITFAPRPVNAYKVYLSQPASNDKLTWYPTFARISASGDFGFTTGPWTYSTDKGKRIFGDYVTIWHHLPKQGWRALIDCGVSHPHSPRPAHALAESAELSIPAARATPPEGTSAADELRLADSAYARIAANNGLSAAFRKFAAPDARYLRINRQPVSGGTGDLPGQEQNAPRLRLSPLASVAATSGDLGYTFGYTWPVAPGTPHHPHSVYLHIWQWTGVGWALVLDLDRPLPQAAKH